MIDHGHSLGIDSNFGQSLIVTGESLKKLAGLKYELEDNIKDKFLDPLNNVKHENLKNISVFFSFYDPNI
jgi:endophilin-A